SSSTCGSWGLPTLPSGWQYHCSPTSSLQSATGTGWIPVNFTTTGVVSLSSLPTDPINASSSNLYYTYITGGSFKLAATLESTKYISFASSDGGTISGAIEMGSNLALGQSVFPSGWIKVPGDSRFSTSDFYVMKYDARCLSATTSQPLTAPDYSTPYHVYYNLSQPCIAPNYIVASTPNGYPITGIKQSGDGSNNDAVKYCQSIGAHLITNNEWQTIAWNAQQQSSNWQGNFVGTNYIYQGNSNGSAALEASNDDSQGYFGINSATYPRNRRILSLSNGQTIWDMGGNVWQWTNDTIIGTNKPVGVAGSWVQWDAVSNFGTLSQQTAGPFNGSWTSSQGVGMYYMGTADANSYGFVRGGYWSNGANAGVEALGLPYSPGSTYYNVGFRCVR
ncbi:MAG: SUMF1/EgtB/PvdO family nonheme iron enzyme, partial [Candidatus Paceibacterota bacterium]